MNAPAAVDKVFNRSKAYGTVSNPVFNARLDDDAGHVRELLRRLHAAEPAREPEHLPLPGGNPALARSTSVSTLARTLSRTARQLDGPPTLRARRPHLHERPDAAALDSPDARSSSTSRSPASGAPKSADCADGRRSGELAVRHRGAQTVNGIVKRFTPRSRNVPDIVAIRPRRRSRALLSRQMDIIVRQTTSSGQHLHAGDFARHLASTTPLRRRCSPPGSTPSVWELSPVVESVAVKGSTLATTITPDGMITGTGATSSVRQSAEADRPGPSRSSGPSGSTRGEGARRIDGYATNNGQHLRADRQPGHPLALRGYVRSRSTSSCSRRSTRSSRVRSTSSPRSQARVRPNDSTTVPYWPTRSPTSASASPAADRRHAEGLPLRRARPHDSKTGRHVMKRIHIALLTIAAALIVSPIPRAGARSPPARFGRRRSVLTSYLTSHAE